MLELLIHTGMKNSPSRDRETARAIANPTNAKGIIGRLHNLANQVEDAALNCEKMRTEAVDFDISTMLEESPRIRLEPPPQDVRREGSAGEPGDNDDSDDDYYYDEDEDMDRLDWLSSLPYSKHHDKVKRRRTRGTCDWLLQRVEFNNWQDGPQSASLWLQGSFGTGKTFLVSCVIDHFLVKIAEAPDAPGFAFFYCDQLSAPDRQTPIPLLRCLIRQLAISENEVISSKVLASLRSSLDDGMLTTSEPSSDTCTEWLLWAVNCYATATIILDGLDMLEHQALQRLMATLAYTLNWCSSTLKIFISSRNGVDMTMLQGTSILSYTITLGHWQLGRNFYDDDSKLYSDMYKVVGEEWPDLPPLHPDFWSDIVRLSEGSFLWAVLQTRILKNRDIEISSTASSTQHVWPVPPDIAHIYDQAYAEYEGWDRDNQLICKRAFMLISCARTPFTNDELLAALHMDLDTGSSRLGGVEKLDEYQLRYMWPDILLLGLDYESKATWKLSHSSVAEYFAEHPMINWSMTTSNSYVAKLCLKLLIGTSQHTSHDSESRSIPHPSEELQIYARRHWAAHIQESGIENQDPLLTDLLKTFFGSPISGSQYYQQWLSSMAADPYIPMVPSSPSFFTNSSLQSLANKPPALTICHLSLFSFLLSWLDDSSIIIPSRSHILRDVATYLSFSPKALLICRKLVERGVDVNKPLSDNGSTLLAYAAARGTAEWVEFLLEKGADVNADIEDLCDSMRIAATRSETRIVELLLHAGAPPDGNSPASTSPLAGAAEAANITAVKLLIAAGADVNRHLRGNFASALAAAASNPDATPLIELLVEHGAEVSMQGGQAGSALAEAGASGNAQGLRCLIRAGADVNQQLSAGEYGSALAAAAAGESIECLRELLSAGAAVNQETSAGAFGSPLLAAAYHGATECLRELIRAGASVTKPVSAGSLGTGLIAADAGGHLPCLRALIEAGADINQIALTGEYGSALVAADDIAILKALIDLGADVNAEISIGEYGSALAGAVLNRDLERIQALLRAGADVNQHLHVGLYGSALAIAAALDQVAILEVLIQAGADVNLVHQSPSATYGSPLVAAASRGAATCVQALINAGAEVDKQARLGPFGTALAATARESGLLGMSVQCIEMLVEAGADVNKQIESYPGGRFGTALVAAAHLGRVRCVRCLIEAGADVTLKVENGAFRTALGAAMAPVSEEDIKFFRLILEPIIILPSKGLVGDKATIAELLRGHGARLEEY